LILKEVGK